MRAIWASPPWGRRERGQFIPSVVFFFPSFYNSIHMFINKDWDFETAVRETSKVYYPGGMTSGQLRNRQVEAWGQLVGKTRALAEFDAAIKRYGSLSAFGKEYRATLPTLRGFREFFENLPDDQLDNIISDRKSADMKKVFISCINRSMSHSKNGVSRTPKSEHAAH